MSKTRYIVAAYDVDKRYGGAAEGGWWYETGELVRIMRVFTSEDKAYAHCRRFNELSGGSHGQAKIGPNVGLLPISSMRSRGRIQAEVHENFAPQAYPTERPHYE